MQRAYYSDPIAAFLDKTENEILGGLERNIAFRVEAAQRDAWLAQIAILKTALAPYRGSGKVYFEYSIPRLGRRIDVVALLGPAVFVLEFKVGEKEFTSHAIDQVWDYARFRALRHRRLLSGAAPQAPRDRCEVADGPDPLVPGWQGGCALVVLPSAVSS